MSVQQLQPHDSTETVPRLAWWCICRYRLELYQCVSILAGTYIALHRLHCVTHCCSALKDCGKEWRHVVPLLACICALALMCMHTHALNGLNWCMWDLLACMVSLDVVYACDITTASAMAWWMSSLLLVRMISPLCVNICESTDLCRGLFLFCVGADRLQSQRVPIVAISFISVSLLWLVLCQLVATVIGHSGKGHDPADGSLVSA